MSLALLALASGALLYLACAAVLSLSVAEEASGLWLSALGAVALCHVVAGFIAIGGAAAWRSGHKGTAAALMALSAAITGAALGVALLVARTFPLYLEMGTAACLLFLALVAACVGLATLLGTLSADP